MVYTPRGGDHNTTIEDEIAKTSSHQAGNLILTPVGRDSSSVNQDNALTLAPRGVVQTSTVTVREKGHEPPPFGFKGWAYLRAFGTGIYAILNEGSALCWRALATTGT